MASLPSWASAAMGEATNAIAVATAVIFVVIRREAKVSNIKRSLLIGGGSDPRYALTIRGLRLVWG